MPQTHATQPHTPGAHWQRAAVAEALAGFDAAQAAWGQSRRGFAQERDIPRTTLQDWLSRREQLMLEQEQAAFFESPAGAQFLHRLVGGAHFAMTWMGTCGIRLVGLLLRLCGVDRYVACSYGVHQQISSKLAESLVEFGAEERARLAPGMPSREVTVCEDETFLSAGICLVAIEAVSGFILLERYAEKRDAETWNRELTGATDGLPVRVVQSAADEAKALARHATDQYAHHSPDLFHMQNELNRATVLPLLRRVKQATAAHEDAQAALQGHVEERDAYCNGPRGRGRPPDFDGRIRRAQASQQEAAAQLAVAQTWRSDALDAVRAIATDYHPYDLRTGVPRTPEELDRVLGDHLDVVRTVAENATLSVRSKKGIEKAARVKPKMVATQRFFHDRVEQLLQGLGLPPPVEEIMRSAVIPAAYLQRVAGRAQQAQRRSELTDAAQRVIAPALLPDGPLAGLDEGERQRLERAAFDAADLFQRSSSCVEGRNGRLAQWEHAQRRLSPKKLEALTVVQNCRLRTLRPAQGPDHRG